MFANNPTQQIRNWVTPFDIHICKYSIDGTQLPAFVQYTQQIGTQLQIRLDRYMFHLACRKNSIQFGSQKYRIRSPTINQFQSERRKKFNQKEQKIEDIDFG